MAQALSDVLADSFRLYINAQGLHWNVEGPLFYSLHKLTEEQYEDLAAANDELAERIRSLGMPAPQTLREFEKRSDVTDLPEKGDLRMRIARMVSDYEKAAGRALTTVAMAEKAGDIKTADLLTERIGHYEEFAWMLRATIATS